MGVLILMFELSRSYLTLHWWIVDSRMAKIAGQGMLFGASLCNEQLTQNWSGQEESDCLIKTKHCDV